MAEGPTTDVSIPESDFAWQKAVGQELSFSNSGEEPLVQIARKINDIIAALNFAKTVVVDLRQRVAVLETKATQGQNKIQQLEARVAALEALP